MQICHMSKPLLAPFVHVKIAGIDISEGLAHGMLPPENISQILVRPKKTMGCP